nr:receptor-like protein 12 [Ipomoea batatas]
MLCFHSCLPETNLVSFRFQSSLNNNMRSHIGTSSADTNFLLINVMCALGQCLLDQKTSLLQIRSNLTFDPLASTKLVQWDERDDCCKWPGVGCNRAGYVTSLDLSNEPITGGFNVSLLLKLRLVSVIRLDGINLSVPFPDFFSDFTNLTVLSLASCNFSGTVDRKVFQFSGSIPSFNLSKNLTVLDLSSNKFTGEIPSFKLSKNLTVLDLSSNKFLGEIPSSHWDGLDNLEFLYLNNNSFSGPIPASLFSLSSLQTLHLSVNKFSGRIIDLQNTTSPLIDLDLGSNNLEGPIPSFLFQLQSLSSLSLSWNKFSGTVQLTKFKNLESTYNLDLSYNNLAIETNISEAELPFFPQFQFLSLASCNLQQIPHFLKNQSRLTMLDLSSNAISGEIPNWIWGINDGYVPYLNFSHNHLTHIQEPMEYGRHDYLDLNSNLLSGKIPPLPRAAVHLDLSNNNFSSMPPDIGDQLPNIRFFSIANNRVSGRIPPSWCHAALLEVLDLSNNTLQGTIPSCLAQNNTNLGVINLKGNHLSGEIPQVSWQSLRVIDLASNHFSGILPANLFLGLKAIMVDRDKAAELEINYLHFTSAAWKVYYQDSVSLSLKGNGNYNIQKILTLFTSIDFSNNQFQGSIPETVGELKLLRLLNISQNALTGNIPRSLEHLKDLEALDLSLNSLTGNIPDQLVSLTFLSFLNLSHNRLVGRIPQGNQFKTFGESSFEENKGLCGFPLHVSCSGNKEPASPVLPELEEEESSDHAEIYTGIGLGFVGGIGGIFVPLLLSRKWRSYYNKKIDGILSKILFQRDCGRTRFRSKSI